MKMGISNLKVYAEWTMSNGAVFHFAIPAAHKVEENKFSDAVEFPFTFDEICQIEIPRSIGKGRLALRNDLESVAALLPIRGLHAVQTHELLTISPSP